MENHWLKNIVVRLYTSNLPETHHFYSSILGIHNEGSTSNQLNLSFGSVSLIFTSSRAHAADNTQNLSFEVYEIDKLWEAIKFKVNILKSILDTEDGEYREFTLQDNNGYSLHFFEKNPSHQLSLNLFDSRK